MKHTKEKQILSQIKNLELHGKHYLKHLYVPNSNHHHRITIQIHFTHRPKANEWTNRYTAQIKCPQTMLLNQVADYQMSKGTPQNHQIAQSSTKY